MQDFKRLVWDLYKKHGKWEDVAAACGNDFSGMTYYKIAHEKTKHPSTQVRRGIVRAAKRAELDITGLDWLLCENKRSSVVIDMGIWKRLKALKNRLEITWDELMADMLENYEVNNAENSNS